MQRKSISNTLLVLVSGILFLTSRTNGTSISNFLNGVLLDERPELNDTTTVEHVLSLKGENPAAVVLDLGIHPNTSTVYRFLVDPLAEDTDLKLSLVVEFMTCIVNANDPEDDVGIYIEGRDGSSFFLCENVTQPDSLFQTVNHISAGKKYFEVTLQGDWSLSTAVLVVTVYKEVDSCSDCPESTFCCEGGASCKGSILREDGQELARCISKTLTCDNRANCGMVCNADESYDTCYWYYYYDFNFGYMSLLAITFFLLLPAMIILLGCYHRHVVMMRRIQAAEELRRRNDNNTVSSVSRPNDHPPTYNEVQNTFDQPPCFCEAIKLPNASGISNEVRDGSNCACGNGNETSPPKY